MIAFLVAPGLILSLLFGESFARFDDLVVPVAAAQMAHAGAIGYILLLKGRRRGSVLARARGVGTGFALALAGSLAMSHGVVGAAWGLAGGAVVSTSLIVHGSRRRAEPGT